MIGSYGSFRSRSFSKERRKGAPEGTTTVRYNKNSHVSCRRNASERLIESNEVMELFFFLTSAAKEYTYYNKTLLSAGVCMLD